MPKSHWRHHMPLPHSPCRSVVSVVLIVFIEHYLQCFFQGLVYIIVAAQLLARFLPLLSPSPSTTTTITNRTHLRDLIWYRTAVKAQKPNQGFLAEVYGRQHHPQASNSNTPQKWKCVTRLSKCFIVVPPSFPSI